jgi:hypothetical protein
MAPDVREAPYFDVLDPCAKVADGNSVLRFASDRAGMATDARLLVDHKAVLHEAESTRWSTEGDDAESRPHLASPAHLQVAGATGKITPALGIAHISDPLHRVAALRARARRLVGRLDALEDA